MVRVSERSGGWNHQFCLHKVGYSKRFGGWMLKSTDIFVADVYNLDPYLCMFRLESSWIINALQPGWRWFVIAQDWDERDEKNRYEALSMGIEREENDILLLLQGMGFYVLIWPQKINIFTASKIGQRTSAQHQLLHWASGKSNLWCNSAWRALLATTRFYEQKMKV